VPGILPVIREVLVDEDRRHSAALAEDPDRLIPESPLGVLAISRGGERIVAVLRDEEHAVHGELAGAEGQGLGDARLDGESVRGGQEPADVVGGLLVGVERGEL
jgi:hypothetical protein